MPGRGVKIWLAFEPVDMRLGFDGLAAKVAHVLQQDPYDGHWFVFRSKNGTRIKILTFDGVGWWLHYRRLEKGVFTWPGVDDRFDPDEPGAVCGAGAGLDWRRVKIPEPIAPVLA
ncbi:MAG: IS66 family insertion sequence element accessory protein TnpB [Burkholderiaceae bacterium]